MSFAADALVIEAGVIIATGVRSPEVSKCHLRSPQPASAESLAMMSGCKVGVEVAPPAPVLEPKSDSLVLNSAGNVAAPPVNCSGFSADKPNATLRER